MTPFTSFICYIDNHQYNKDSPAEAIYCHSKRLLWPRFRHCPHLHTGCRSGTWFCRTFRPRSPQVVQFDCRISKHRDLRMQLGETNRSFTTNSQSPPQGSSRSRIAVEREARHVGVVPRQSRTTERTARTAGLKFEAWVTRPVRLKQMPLFWRPTNEPLYFNHQQLRNARNIFAQAPLSFNRDWWANHRVVSI